MNDALKSLAEPAKNSHLNELIERLTEMALELGLDHDNEALFDFTDSQIIALNMFFKL